MEPLLIDIENGKPVPSACCYTINAFKNIIDEYGDNAGKVFTAIQYQLSLNPSKNPFAYYTEEERASKVIEAVCPELDLNTSSYNLAFEMASKMFKTTEYQNFDAYKTLMERMTTAVHTIVPNLSAVSAGGNMSQIKEAIKSHKELKAAYNESFQEYILSMSGEKDSSTDSYDEDDDDDLD